jgi:C4-dicarboxylate-specific signal transduction histidine kinase
MANPVAIVDSGNRVSVGNQSFESTFGPAGQLAVSELGLGGLLTTDASSRPTEVETSKGTFLVSARLLNEPGGEQRTLVVMTDVTELRRLQEDHRRRSVLAEIGAIVSGINHEIMNILSPVGFYLQKAKDACAGGDGAAPLSVVTQRIESLDRLCRDLRAYYKSPDLSLRSVALNDLVGNTLSDLAQTQGSDWVPPSLSGLNLSVTADSQKLRQVLLNVIKNAWEAMQGVSEKRWSVEAFPSDKDVLIRITDSGPGVPPDSMERLFEPFFTTKGDCGTGLGLAVAARIAEAHGAGIAVDSIPDKGTTVTLRWPSGR